MTRSLSEQDRAAVARALNPSRGPAPVYRPTGPGPNILDPNHPNWRHLEGLRQQAFDLGISETTLVQFQRGYCPQQIGEQIRDLEHWIGSNGTSAA